MAAQMSGKKSGGSSNSSMVITPASTPVNAMPNGQQASPPPNNAPKYGTLVPNRIFVGGISANTTETELLQLFSNYGTVKAAKIIQDRAGVSKGYGFITFESEDDAKRLQRDQDNIVLRERKLNIAPAIKKQPFSRAFDGSSPPAVATGFAPNFFPPGSMPFFQGGLAYYPQPPSGPADPATQPPTVFQTPSVYPPQSAPPQAAPYQPVMFPPQPIYMPQQYPMPMPCDFNYYANGGASFIGGGGAVQNGAGPQQQSITTGAAQLPPQRPNSPPRHHCFTQPLPAAAIGAYPGQDVYYNMPLYPVEGGMYSSDPAALEAMALASGVMPEDFQHAPPAQDDYNTQPQQPQKDGGGVLMRQQPPPPPQSAPPSQPPTPHAQAERRTATPVVSLLSLDHQQEKDLLSMQSGRRRKPPPSTPPAVAVHHAAYNLPPPHLQHAHHPLANGYAAFPTVSVEYYIPAGGQKGMTNGWSNLSAPKHGWPAPPTLLHPHHAGGVSSPRPDGFVGMGFDSRQANSHHHHNHHPPVHNHDEKRRYSQPNLPRHAPHAHRPGYNPSPSPGYQAGATSGGSSPGLPVQKRRTFIPSGKAQYRNANRFDNVNNNGANSSTFVHKSAPPSTNGTPPPPPQAASNNNNNINAPPDAKCRAGMSRSTPSPGAFVSQMQPVPTSIPQHFVAPARNRSRRTMRRGGGLGECGAGDAPLTGDAMADACTKMDSLKL